jgi:hypothetical protein
VRWRLGETSAGPRALQRSKRGCACCRTLAGDAGAPACANLRWIELTVMRHAHRRRLFLRSVEEFQYTFP